MNIGEKYHRLTVESIHDKQWSSGQLVQYATCRCECGKIKQIQVRHIASGATKSCGCLKSEISSAGAKARHTTHGMSKRPVHHVWWSMIQRCNNPNHRAYPLYGGRGIKVDSSWMSFEAFLSDMGEPRQGDTLDRIDTNKGYSKSNCRWASMKTQQRNRRNNRMVSINGIERPLAEWAENAGLRADTLSFRIKSGWPEERLLTPARQQLELV